MDHQIEHHVDIRAALLEARKALGVDEQRPVHARREGAKRLVEALDMADLEHFPRPAAAISASACSSVGAIGFSTSTCSPAQAGGVTS